MPTLGPMDRHILAGDYALNLRSLRRQTGATMYKLCALIRDVDMPLKELAHHFVRAGYNEGTALSQAARIRNFARNDVAYFALKQAVLDQQDVFEICPTIVTKRRSKKKL